MLLPALALEILAGVVVMGWASLAGLLVARILSGLGIGAVTATAMAWLTELHDPGSRQPANTGHRLHTRQPARVRRAARTRNHDRRPDPARPRRPPPSATTTTHPRLTGATMHRTAPKIVGFRRAGQVDPTLAPANLESSNQNINDIEWSTR